MESAATTTISVMGARLLAAFVSGAVEVDWLTSLPCHSPWGGGVRPTIAANVARLSMCDIITSYRALF